MDASNFHIHRVEWDSRKIGRFWSYLTSTPHAERSYFSGLFGDRILTIAEQYLPLRDARILDYGCGPGLLLKKMLDRRFHASGLEFSEESAKKARSHCQNYSTFGGVTVASQLPSSVKPHSVDVVFLVEVVEHLLPHEREQTLQEITRLLAPGGHLVLTTPHNEDLGRVETLCPDCGCVFHPWQHVSSFSIESLCNLLRNYGFESSLCRATTLDARWSGRLLRKARRLIRGRKAEADEPHLFYIGRRTTG
jgi:SAM-dependent methyltransferase